MSVSLYQHISTIEYANGRAKIMRTLSGKSFVVEIWRTGVRVDTRRKRSRESVEREAQRLIAFWGLDTTRAANMEPRP